MTPDAGILTTLLRSFGDAFVNGLGFIHGDAKWLLGILMVIDLVLAVVLNLSDGDHMKTLVTKILKYGFFIWLVMDYRNLTNTVLNTFQAVGLKAGGGAISASLLTDPSEIATYGIWVTEPIFQFIDNLGTIDVLKNLHKIMFTGFTGLIIILCFFIIGIQIFITYLEFYLVATLALILLPFGVNRRTAFLGEKAIGAVLSFGIKLMVLAFIAAVAIPLVKTWSIPVDPTNEQIFCLLLGSMALTFLAWHAPTMAAGLLSGHPTLTAGSAAGFGAAGAAATVGLGWAGAALGSAGIHAGHRATMAGARGGGQISEAYRSGGIAGITRLGGAYVSKGAHKISDPFVSSFNSGKETAASMLDDSGGSSNTGGGGVHSAGSGASPKMDFDRLARKIRYVHNSVPPSHGEGGGSARPNLKGGDES